ncbi:MAG: nucleotidyl transferase AbiEii/AbiGii toxin family protein [Candidatus Binatia bacterium]
MNRLAGALARLLGHLTICGVRGALVGGLAVSARAEPRLTRDLDLAVEVVSDAEAERLIQRLVTLGYATVAIIEQEHTHRLATVRLRLPGASERGVVADLLFASSGIEAEVVAAAEPLEVFPGVVVPVAQIGHLVALKLLARDDHPSPGCRRPAGTARRRAGS